MNMFQDLLPHYDHVGGFDHRTSRLAHNSNSLVVESLFSSSVGPLDIGDLDELSPTLRANRRLTNRRKQIRRRQKSKTGNSKTVRIKYAPYLLSSFMSLEKYIHTLASETGSRIRLRSFLPLNSPLRCFSKTGTIKPAVITSAFVPLSFGFSHDTDTTCSMAHPCLESNDHTLTHESMKKEVENVRAKSIRGGGRSQQVISAKLSMRLKNKVKKVRMFWNRLVYNTPNVFKVSSKIIEKSKAFVVEFSDLSLKGTQHLANGSKLFSDSGSSFNGRTNDLHDSSDLHLSGDGVCPEQRFEDFEYLI